MVRIYLILSILYCSIKSHNLPNDVNNEILSYFEALQKLNFKKSNKLALSIRYDNNLKNKLTLLTKIIEDNRQTKLSKLDNRYESLFYDKEHKLDTYLYYLIKGYEYLYYSKNRIKSYKTFSRAYEISLEIDSKPLSKFALHSILLFYKKGVLQGTKDYTFFLNEYKNLCNTEIDWLLYYSHKFNLLSQTVTYNEKKTKNQKLYDKIFIGYDSLIEQSQNLGKLKFLYYRDKGNYVIRKDPDKAQDYYKKSKSYHTNGNYYRTHSQTYYTNLSRVESLKGKYKEGIDYVNKAKKYSSYNDSLLELYYIKAYKANYFYKLNVLDSAYIYEKELRFLNYKINFQKENQEVSELRVELNTAEKEKENIQLRVEKEKNKIYLIITILLLILTGVIATLTLQSSKRKRKLAEQQKELESQKNLTLIKEQEITTINAMVEGQEKERKRVAEDLHDNLGSVLATLKLHFENLRINREKKKINQEELFDKTENLIDEAYLKVRKIAHAKNAGVIANQGLLAAVKIMAEKISSAEKLKIEVVDFGLDKRLENTLEITVFRIIQELTTNIIKHAKATLATIQISLFDQTLNIIIEDNGKGFNPKKLQLKSGIGISSIKTRIEHLEGTFEIDSTLGKGSTFILNIPIA